MKAKIVLLPGDGIGPDVTAWGKAALEKVAKLYSHDFTFEEELIGGISIDTYGIPLTDAALTHCQLADAVLMGAVGGEKWSDPNNRPEQGLLGIRKGLEAYANLRPSKLFPELAHASPLREDKVRNGLDILIVRELTGGIYFGKSGISADKKTAFDTEEYSVYEIERLLKTAAEAALKRKKHITVVDKANIMESSRLWRRTSEEFFKAYPDIRVDYLYVDNASMQLVSAPEKFDVIATSNMFGDILSDEASVISGSIGMLPSASIGGRVGLYEPVHGSAPDIKGQDIANPCASVLSAAMLLRYSFGLEKEAVAVENAVSAFLASGYRTRDIASGDKTETIVGTVKAGELITENIRQGNHI